MILTINNQTAGTLTYLDGVISIAANDSYTSTDAQLIPLTLDNNLYNDITAQNVSLSDGVNDYFLEAALNYIKRVIAEYYYRVNLNQEITALDQTVELAVVNMGSIIVQIEGTFVATLNFEATVDGTNWFTWYGMDNSTLLIINNVTIPSQVLFNTGAIQNFRVKCSDYTSGTAVVSISANQGFSGQVSPFTGTSSDPGCFPVSVVNKPNVIIEDTNGDAFTSTGNALDVNLKTSSITLPISGSISFTAPQHVIVDTAPSTAVTNTGTFAVQAAATLAAETTKVIGTVNVAASQTIGIATGSAQIGHLEANQSVNNAQIAGATTAVNNGTASTGCQRVTIASDNTAFAVNATLSAETTKVIGTVNVASSQVIALTTGSAQIGHLEANQSINNAQVNGSTVVTSVTGVQDVMPRKRTGATGLSPNYSNSHITSKTTTTPTAATAYVSTIVISCSGAGTAWTLKIQDKGGTPAILVPAFTLTVPTTGLPVILNFTEPILMTSGIDIVTAGTTAGTVDVLITYWQ